MLKIIYYTAEWCMPCKAFRPLVDKVSEEMGFTVEYIDVDTLTHPPFSSVPALAWYDGDIPIGVTFGAYPEPAFRKLVKEFTDEVRPLP